jgi:hypothetical protein
MKRPNKVTVILSACIVAFSFAACKKGKLPDPDKVTIDDNPQFGAKIDGQVVTYRESNSLEIYGGEHSISAIDTSFFIYTVTLADPSATTSYIEIKIGTFAKPTGGYPSVSEFNAFFTTGSKPYSAGAVAGVEVIWWDDAMTAWSTANGAPGGSFKLEALQAENILGDDYMKFKAVFSCMLYDGSGNSIELTDGLYLGYFANI